MERERVTLGRVPRYQRDTLPNMNVRRDPPARSRTYSVVVFLVLFSLLFAPTSALAQDYTYAECAAVESDALPAEIERLAFEVLDQGQSQFEFEALVERQWMAVGMDLVLDAEVDAAIQSMMDNEPYWQRFWSGWSGGKAEEFAEAVAEQVFSSPTFTETLDELSLAIADEVVVELQAIAARSASISLLCLQQYVGERHSESLLQLFETEVESGVGDVDYEATQDDLTVSQLDTHSKAAAGVSVIIVSQLVRRISISLGKKIAGRVAGRIAGRLLGRLGSAFIPFAGWVIGGGLILWDLYEGGKGSLPQIQEALQSEEVKASLRAEVTLAVQEGLREEIDVIAEQVAAELMTSWLSFCDRHVTLCILSEESLDFQFILDVTPVAELATLSSLANIYLAKLGRDSLDDALQSGEFEDLLQLSPATHVLLNATGSPHVVLAWAEVAGPQIDIVVESRLYAYVNADSILDDRDLATLLYLDDRAQLLRYLDLEAETRLAVASIAEEERHKLLDTHKASEINWLFQHANVEDLLFPVLVSQINSGVKSFEALQAGPPTAIPVTPTMAPIATATPESGLAAVLSALQASNIGIGGLVLSVVLAISAFAIVAIYVVKRTKY